MTTIWDSTATTPAATHRVPVDRSSSSSPAHWTGQQIADVRAYIGETVNSLGPINTNQSLSLADGRYIAATITGNVQFTFTSVPTGATDLFLELTDAGAYAITFAASLTWTGGTAPTLPTSGVALLHLRTRNGGTTYLASMVSDEQEFAASAITSGTLATARLGSGTANSGTFLRGDQTWAAVGGGSPGGSGSELQYRGGPSTFSAASNTHWDAVNGRLSIGAGTSPAGMLHAQASAASVIPAVLQGAASQTAALQQWRDSAGSDRLSVSLTSGWSALVSSAGLALSPGGTGAISAHVPDSTATGGNARGQNAVDLQTGRDGAAQVASGDNSAILGGFKNTASGVRSGVLSGNTNVASGQDSCVPCGRLNTSSGFQALAAGDTCTSSNTATVAFGRLNTASGIYSWVPGGSQATTRGIQAARAFASVQRAVLGDSQVFGLVCRITTSSTTATVLTSRDTTTNGSDICVLPNNSSAHFRARVCARNDTSVGSGSWEICGTIGRGANAASTAIVGSTTIRTFGVSASLGSPTVDVVADTTRGAAVIQVTAANSDTTYWVGDIELIQAA